MGGVLTPETLRDQRLDGQFHQLSLCVPEEFFCPRVRRTDGPTGLRDEDRVGGECEEVLQSGLSELDPGLSGAGRWVLPWEVVHACNPSCLVDDRPSMWEQPVGA
jgi:hypothetical protein